jgi:ABC-type transporter Mla subunit MlaD
MPRRARIDALGAALAGAAAARDWPQLDGAVTRLAPCLAELAAQGAWSAPERAALERLRQAHGQAAALCASEQERVAQRLEELQNNKAGWVAYALDSETETAQDQA